MLTPWPALLVESGEKVLVVTDLHLGMEHELAKSGISIPYQTNRILAELGGLIEQNKPDRLLLLGDVKHGVPYPSFQERKEIPRFFNTLLEQVPKIDVTRGNHDASIESYLPEAVSLHSSKGILFGSNPRIAAFHGHAWPDPSFLSSDIILMGHNHPAILLPIYLGLKISQRVWIKGKYNGTNLAKMFIEQSQRKTVENPLDILEAEYQMKIKDPQTIIIPTFNDLLGGLAFNQEPPKSLLGPLLGTDLVPIDEFDVHLLDGSYLGKLGFLRKLLKNHSLDKVNDGIARIRTGDLADPSRES